jgi:hypothetical protein
VARRRQARGRMRLCLEEDGRPSPPQRVDALVGDPGSDDAHISGLRYGAHERARFRMRFRLKIKSAGFGVVLGGSMVIIGDVARREDPGDVV